MDLASILLAPSSQVGLKYINIFIFNHQRLTFISPYLKIYQHFYFPSFLPEAEINWSNKSNDMQLFFFQTPDADFHSLSYINISCLKHRGWLKMVHFVRYIIISNFKHQRLILIGPCHMICNISFFKHQRLT